MKRRSFYFALFSLGLVATATAQNVRPIPYPVIPGPRFERALENGTRSTTGEPGPNYWTNTADYFINATLEPATRMVRGSESIVYTNNSPDTLNVLMVHLRQNLHKEGVVRNRPQRLTGGVNLLSVAANGQLLREGESYRVNGTVMSIRLANPLLPETSTRLSFDWEFEVPERGAPRMGTDGEIFFVAYWYPQMAVYDDVSGWKADPYMGEGEFYMGYGSYDVSITVPEGWLVGATGELENPEEVLSEQSRRRLNQATNSHDTVNIVTEDDRSPGFSTVDSPDDMLTWRFLAHQARDFAFGTSDKYLWDATTAEVGDRDGDDSNDLSMIHAFYRPGSSDWHRSAEYGQFTIEFLSDMFMPYPYPHMTTVEGVIGGGMEFPMITHIGTGRPNGSVFGVTFHEIAHMYFPMIVGQDEKENTWMDEGLVSFNTNEGSAAFNNTNTWDPRRQGYYRIAGTGDEYESRRHADRYPLGTGARGTAAYNKPAVALHALRGIVGQEPFMAAYREYARRWAFKHPQPEDLFNTFEDVLGRDFDWFWTTMFYTTWTLDQSIDEVTQGSGGVIVTIKDLGLSPFPVPLRVTYADGTIVEETVPVEEWLSDKKETRVQFESGTVEKVEIDPGQFLPDVDRSNNVWPRE